MALGPVDFDPFAVGAPRTGTLTPVEHDPFAPKTTLLGVAKRTGGQMLSALGTTVEDITGPNRVTGALRQTGQDIVARHPSEITTLRDVVEKPGAAIKEGVGQLLPQLGAAWAGARTGALAGSRLGPAGAAVGGLVGGVLPIAIQEYGGIREAQQQEGTENIPRALASAAGATALEFLGPEGKIIRGLRPTAGGIAKTAAKGVLRGALVEAPTEVAQTALERYGADQPLTGEEAVNEYGVSGILGGIGGGAAGGPIGAVEAALPAPSIPQQPPVRETQPQQPVALPAAEVAPTLPQVVPPVTTAAPIRPTAALRPARTPQGLPARDLLAEAAAPPAAQETVPLEPAPRQPGVLALPNPRGALSLPYPEAFAAELTPEEVTLSAPTVDAQIREEQAMQEDLQRMADAEALRPRALTPEEIEITDLPREEPYQGAMPEAPSPETVLVEEIEATVPPRPRYQLPPEVEAEIERVQSAEAAKKETQIGALSRVAKETRTAEAMATGRAAGVGEEAPKTAMQLAFERAGKIRSKGHATKVREARAIEAPSIQDVAQHEGQVPQSKESLLPQLRGARDYGVRGVGRELRGVSQGRGGEAESGAYVGSEGQQRQLRASQRPVGNEETAGPQYEKESSADIQRENTDARRMGGGDRAGAVNVAPPPIRRGAVGREGVDDAAQSGRQAGASEQLEEISRAEQDTEAGPDDGGRGPQQDLREEGRDTAERGERVQPGGQQIAVPPQAEAQPVGAAPETETANAQTEEGQEGQETRLLRPAKPSTRRERLNKDTDSLVVAITKLGGLSPEAAAEAGMDLAGRQSMRVPRGLGYKGIQYLVHRNGADWDAMRERLTEEGYYPDGEDYNRLMEMVDDEIRSGRPQHFSAAATNLEQLLPDHGDAMDALDLMPDQEERIESEYETLTAAEKKAFDTLLVDARAQLGEDEIETLLEDVARRLEGASQQAYINEVRNNLTRLFNESQTRDQEPAAEVDARGQAESVEARRDGTRDVPVEQSPLLETYSEQDLAAREAERQAADTERQEAERRAAEKEQANRERETFALTGSDREADQAAAQGQADLLSQPAEEPAPAEAPAATPPAETVTAPSEASTPETETTEPAAEEAAPPTGPYTLAEHSEVSRRLREGEITAEELKAAFQRFMDSRDAITAELNKKTLKELAPRGTHGETKPQIVKSIVENMMRRFIVADSFMWSPFDKSYEATIREYVDGVTDAKIKEYAEKQRAAIDEREQRLNEARQAIENPQSLSDFRLYMEVKRDAGVSERDAYLSLTPEQRVKYDELVAEEGRARREAAREAEKTRVQAAGQLVDAEIIETKHTQKGYDLFVVRLAERVPRADYDRLNANAKRMGGYYSSFKGRGAVPGFQFRTREAAEAFQKLAGGDTAAAQAQIQERRDAFAEDKSQTAVERLRTMADALEAKADESLGRDRLANTERRARFAARAEANANYDKALAKTMRNLANAIESGRAKFLDRVRQKAQVEMLQGMLRHAKDEQLRKKYPSYGEYERHQYDPPDAETADFVEYPTYTGYRSNYASLARQLLEIDGAKKLGERLLKLADDVTAEYEKFARANFHKVSTFRLASGEPAVFRSREQAEESLKRSGLRGKAIVLPIKRGENAIVMGPEMARERGLWNGDPDKRITVPADLGAEIVEKVKELNARRQTVIGNWHAEAVYDQRKRLAALGLQTPSELRAAMREFIGLKEDAARPSRLKELERALIGNKSVGVDFFPTPKSVAAQLVETAGIEPGMSVLEPSAGNGNIADAIREAGVEPDVIEQSGTLREILEEKGYNLVGQDFMDVKEGAYDRILMNPPFSNRMDVEHVRRAYELLKPGGKLVAIMSEGPFFGQDRTASEFRDWLDSIGGTSEKLPEGTFLDPSLPVNTGVNARVVTIEKGETESKFSRGAIVMPSGLAVSDIRAALGREFGPRFLERNPWFKVVQSVSDLPQGAQAPGTRGVTTHGGEVYLVADHVTADGARDTGLLGVALHEGAHANMASMLGRENWQRVQNWLEVHTRSAQRGTDNEITRAIREARAAIPNDTPDRHVAEETLAYMIQQRANHGIPMIRKVLGWLRAWAFRLGLSPKILNTDALVSLARMAMQARTRGAEAVLTEAPVFSRPTLPMRTAGLPADAQHIHTFTTDKELKAHPDYQAAKAGDVAAAARLVANLVSRESLRVTKPFGNAIYLPVRAVERTGDNAIPWALARRYAGTGEVDTEIVQTNKAYHTGADPMERLIARAFFDGHVQAGRDYVLVDDVTTMGGTLSDLAAYVQRGGGRVVGTVTLTNASRATTFTPSPGQIRTLEGRLGNEIRELFHIEPAALTADEARYLIGFRTADELRGRAAKAESERGRRLLSKGVQQVTPETPADAGVSAFELGEDTVEINLSLTDTPAFKNWFGKSKMVDKDGEPRTFYHYTDAEFDAFDPGKVGSATQHAASGLGFFFSPEKLKTYGNNKIKAWLKVENPYRMSLEELQGLHTVEAAKARAAELRHDGYDGVVMKSVGAEYVIAFKPTQIKSTDNFGDFDPEDPRFRYSREGDAGRWALGMPFNDVAKRASEEAGAIFQSSRTFNRWWHRTVGTQYHKAQVDPHFRRVFDAGQDFLNDTSRYAMEAEAEAPDLLLRMETFREIFKRGARDQDMEAVSRVLYDGTLLGGGDPMRGVVWSDDQLRQRGLNDKQIGYYRQARAAVDASLDNMAKSILSRISRTANLFLDREMSLEDMAEAARQQIDSAMEEHEAALEILNDEDSFKAQLADYTESLDDGRPQSQAQELVAKFKADHENSIREHENARQQLEALKTNINEVEAKTRGLKDNGYFPLMRFGSYTVNITDQQGKEEFFGLYESQREANKAAKELAAIFPDSNIETGVMSQKGHQLFRGMTPETLSIFAEVVGLDQDPLMQDYLRVAVSSRSALKRLIHRQGIAGFSEDARRTLASFVTSNARATSSNYHMGEMLEAVNAIPKQKGDVKDEAVDLYRYLTDPQEEAPKLRALLFFQFIGGSVASAMVNATQPVTMTLPYLSQYVSAAKAGAILSKASREAAIGKPGKDVQAAYERAMTEGIIAPHEIYQLMAQARGQTGVGGAMTRFSKIWGSFFSLAEAFNRRTSFIAAYRVAVENKVRNPYEFAKQAVVDTQGIYCVDEETECLTADGWKRHDELRPWETVYGVDENGALVETKLVDVHRFAGPIKATEFRNSNGLSMVVTDDHVCLVQNYNSRDKKWQRLKKVKARDLKQSYHFLRVPLVDATKRKPVYTDDEVRLFAWVAAEGHYFAHRGCIKKRGVGLVQSESHNPHYVAEIDALLDRLGGHYNRKVGRKDRMVCWQLRKPLWEKIGEVLPDKIITPQLVSQLTVPQMSIFLDTFVKGDGHIPDEGGSVIAQKDVRNLDSLQAMAVLAGVSSTKHARIGKHDFGTLYLAKNSKRAFRKEMTATELFIDMAWCPETECGTWIARRNGRTFVTGNSRANRPNWARGPVGATVFTFKQFSIAYLEFLKRLPPKQRALALGILVLAAGVDGLPGADDLDDIIDTLGQWLGFNTNTQRWKREAAEKILGKHGADFVLRGVSAGLPIDISMRMGIGNLIPGSGAFKKSTTDQSRDFAEVLGPAGGLAVSGFKALERAAKGDAMGAVKEIAPKTIKDVLNAAEMARTGEARDTRGRLITKDVTPADVFWRFIGFNPATIANESRRLSEAYTDIQLHRVTEGEIAEKWARGIVDKEPDAVAAAKKQLADWNRRNPDRKIEITQRQIMQRVKNYRMSRQERFIKSAPKELRRHLQE